MRLELVFRGAQDECAYNPNKISSFAPELVFRQIPGKWVERGRHPQGLRRRLGGIVELDPVGGCVAAVRRPTPCRAAWHFGFRHAHCRAPTRGSDRNLWRQIVQGRLRALDMVIDLSPRSASLPG